MQKEVEYRLSPLYACVLLCGLKSVPAPSFTVCQLLS